MSMHRMRNLVCAAALGLFGLLSPAAQGGTRYVVAFDPPFTLFGAAVVDAEQACLANNGVFGPLIALNGCFVKLVSLDVTFNYNPGVDPDQVVRYVPELDLPMPLIGIQIANHELIGLATSLLLPIRLEVQGEIEEIQGLNLDQVHAFNFVEDECDATVVFTGTRNTRPPNLNNQPPYGVQFTACGPNGPLAPLTGEITSIQRVPEPGTLALLFGAMGAGWIVRRRRSAG
jgi:hypothetical protein